MVEALSEVVSIESFNHVFEEIFGFLICTLISKNQGLKKSRSASNQLEKFQVLQTWIFFSVCHLDFFQVYGMNGFAGPEKFSKF